MSMPSSMLLKTTHLRRCTQPASLRRTTRTPHSTVFRAPCSWALLSSLLIPRLFRQLVLVIVVALFAIVVPVAAVGPPVPASPPNYVVDLAGVIDDGVEARTNALLRELEQQTTAQLVVLTLPTLEGESLEAFSLDLAHNRWKLGQKGKDNGVLLTLAMQERKYRIEVGYGLEGVLPDSLVGSLGREVLVPAFRAGDFGGGIAALAGELATRIAAASGVTLSGELPVPTRRPPRSAGKPGPLATGLVLVLILVFIYLLIRHPQLLVMMLLSSRGGSRDSWGGGGGGFGGGGGGGFGGGGSSGSW